eukprot:281885_1
MLRHNLDIFEQHKRTLLWEKMFSRMIHYPWKQQQQIITSLAPFCAVGPIKMTSFAGSMYLICCAYSQLFDYLAQQFNLSGTYGMLCGYFCKFLVSLFAYHPITASWSIGPLIWIVYLAFSHELDCFI